MCKNEIHIVTLYFITDRREKPMLSEEIAKLESENRHLKALLEEIKVNLVKTKDCTHCKFYMQYYGRTGGVYHKVYAGHCACEVPVKKRKGKKEPVPDDTCLCFEGRI